MFNITSRCGLFLHLAVLLSLCSVLYFPYLGRVPFFNKGEPREAIVVQEIVQHGNWLFPLKKGEEVPSKPPLFHWFAALASILGRQVNEASVRFPSALFATLCVLLLYGTGRHLFDARVGLLAAVVLATTAGFQSEAITARVDMTLTLFVTLILIMFYLLYEGILKRSWWFYAFYLLSGFGLLAKGPVGLILPGMVICLFLALKKRWDFLWRLCFHRGAVLTLLIGISWYGIALAKGGEEFFGRQIIHENLARFFVSGEGGSGHVKPFYYYFPYLMLEGLPWSLFLPFVLVDWFKNKAYVQDRNLYLMLAVGLIFLFFSLSAGKRSVYILPLYPPLSLLIGSWLGQAKEEGIHAVGFKTVGWLSLFVALLLLLSLVALSGGKDLSWFLSYVGAMSKPREQSDLLIIENVLNRAGWWLLLFLLLSALLWLFAALCLFAMNRLAATACLVFVSVLMGLAVQGMVLPAIAETRSYQPFMAEVNRRVAENGSLAIYGEGWDYTSVIFYRGARVPVLQGDLGSLRQRMGESDGYYIMGEREWKKMKALGGLAFSPELKSGGTGPEGKEPIVLIRSVKDGQGE